MLEDNKNLEYFFFGELLLLGIVLVEGPLHLEPLGRALGSNDLQDHLAAIAAHLQPWTLQFLFRGPENISTRKQGSSSFLLKAKREQIFKHKEKGKKAFPFS